MSKGEIGFLSFLMLSIGVFNTLTLLTLDSPVIEYVAKFVAGEEGTSAALVANKALR